MASTSGVEKAALASSIAAAKVAIRGMGGSEVTAGVGRRVTTASTKTVSHAKSAGVRYRHNRVRRVRLRRGGLS